MMKKILLSVLMLLPMFANAKVEIGGIYYNLNKEEKIAEVTSNPSKYSGNIVIPKSVLYERETYNVTSIGDYAFYCSNVTSVTIPNSVTSIGIWAFQECFSLSSVTIPNSVTSIGLAAFLACYGLTSLTIPSSVTYIGSGAFDFCKNLKSVHISDLEAWCNIEFCSGDSNPLVYARHLFLNGKEVKDLVIPNSVTSIGNYAFYYSGLTSVTIPNSVTSIGNYAFSYCSDLNLVNSEIQDPFSIDDNVFSGISSDAILQVPKSTKSKYEVFSGWTKNFKEIVMLEEDIKAFAVDGVNYNVKSFNDKTIVVSKGSYGPVLVIPPKVSYLSTSWEVTSIESDALTNSPELCAIIWNPEVAFSADVTNPNLLLYVKNASYAPATIKNVVVNGFANSIMLTDADSGNNFYCPQEFTAKNISYTHHYKMETGFNESKGWETIALPFDVQKITHQSKGEITPFANWESGDEKKPFWLMTYGNSGWTDANSIKANTPYIISMPNHDYYKDEFKLFGNIIFSAENVTIPVSENLHTTYYNGRTFIPNYVNRSDDSYYSLNVNNDYVTYNGSDVEGSKFFIGLRSVHPFEAYMTTTSNSTRSIAISDDMTTGIEEIKTFLNEHEVVRVYNLQGQQLKMEACKSIEDVKRKLPTGVYIINGKKQIIR